MSYELAVQRFENGDAAPMALAAFRAVWQPHTDRHEPQLHYWHVTADDGGEADLYAELGAEALDSLTVARFSPGRVLDLLTEFIGAADAVVLAPDCPALLAHENQRRHLPGDLRPAAVVVRTGLDVHRTLQTR